jgi:uncharacterized membrane protein
LSVGVADDSSNSLMPFLQWASLIGVVAFSALALRLCWRFSHFQAREKIIYSILILALPLLGAVIFFRTKETVEASIRRHTERQRRYRKR